MNLVHALLLASGICLFIWAFYGLLGIIEGAMDARRERRDEKWYRRKMLQENIREIIERMIEERESMILDQALEDTIAEYRQL